MIDNGRDKHNLGSVSKVKGYGEMKKWQKISISIGVALLVILLAGFFYIKNSTYQPTETAVQAATAAEKERDVLFFEGEKGKPTILFYQGALVENTSYSIWAEQVAAAGFSVYLLKQPLNMAILGQNNAEKIIDDKNIHSYIIGGHSLGGVIGSRFAHEHLADTGLKGVFFLASYPDKKGDLTSFDGGVLSITADSDDVLNEEKYTDAKEYLPANTIFEEITGGNHAGFGSYGKQKGDGQAEITNAEQQQLVGNMIIRWASQLAD